LAVAAGQDVLHLLPGLDRHQRRMLAFVLNAVIGDLADVVRASQESMKLADGYWFGGSFRSWHRHKSLVDQLSMKTLEAPLACSKGIERPGHERPALGIDLDLSLLDTVDDVPNIEVAQVSLA